MTRDELLRGTRALADEGERIAAEPALEALRDWLGRSDSLLRAAWGEMDRYHLSWLMVGRPRDAIRGRPMTAAEEVAYVREVAQQKTAALRMSLRAVEEGMPFVGEDAETGSSGGAPGDEGQQRELDGVEDRDLR